MIPPCQIRHPSNYASPGRFRRGLNDTGFDLLDENILLVPYDVESTRVKAIITGNEPITRQQFLPQPTLSYCHLRATRDLGMKLPQEVTVLGFNDLDLAEYVGLSTISQHLDK